MDKNNFIKMLKIFKTFALLIDAIFIICRRHTIHSVEFIAKSYPNDRIVLRLFTSDLLSVEIKICFCYEIRPNFGKNSQKQKQLELT